jgi:hypothetical protein
MSELYSYFHLLCRILRVSFLAFLAMKLLGKPIDLF